MRAEFLLLALTACPAKTPEVVATDTPPLTAPHDAGEFIEGGCPHVPGYGTPEFWKLVDAGNDPRKECPDRYPKGK